MTYESTIHTAANWGHDLDNLEAVEIEGNGEITVRTIHGEATFSREEFDLIAAEVAKHDRIRAAAEKEAA